MLLRKRITKKTFLTIFSEKPKKNFWKNFGEIRDPSFKWGSIFINMKVILSESKFKSVFSNWLEKNNIKPRIQILDGSWDNKHKSVIVFLYLTYDGEPLGSTGGYIFTYKLVDDKLEDRYLPNEMGEIVLFKLFPTEYVIDYFNDEVKDYIYNKMSTQ